MKRKEESVYKRFIDQKGGRLDGASTPRNGARAGGGVSIRFDCRKMVMRSGETLPKEGRLNFDATCRKNAKRGHSTRADRIFLKPREKRLNVYELKFHTQKNREIPC